MIKLSSLCNAAWRGGFERSEVLRRAGPEGPTILPAPAPREIPAAEGDGRP